MGRRVENEGRNGGGFRRGGLKEGRGNKWR